MLFKVHILVLVFGSLLAPHAAAQSGQYSCRQIIAAAIRSSQSQEYPARTLENQRKHLDTGLRYFSSKEMKTMRVKAGKDGRAFFPGQKKSAVDTSDAILFRNNDDQLKGEGIFVMNKKGDLYLSKTAAVGYIHHTSFGIDPIGAGQMRVENGKITMISNLSGHYLPHSGDMLATLNKLDKAGYDLKGTWVSVYTSERQLGNARNFYYQHHELFKRLGIEEHQVSLHVRDAP